MSGKHDKRSPSSASRVFRLCIVGIVLYAALYLLVSIGVSPDIYELTVGSPSSSTIYATKDVINAYLTGQKQTAAAAAVENRYLPIDPSVQERVLTRLSGCFTSLNTFIGSNTADGIRNMTDGEFAEAVKDLPIKLDRLHAVTLLETDSEDFNAVCNLTRTAVNNIMRMGLQEGHESDTYSRISQELLSAGNSTPLVSVLSSCVRYSVEPNVLIDKEATEAARQEARDAVEDEIVVKGEVIVREGELVTLSQYKIVEALGLLDNTVDWHLRLGLGLLVLAVEGSLALYLIRFERRLLMNVKLMVLLAFVLIITVALCLVASRFSAYIMPVSLAMLLIALLIDPRLGVFCNFLTAVVSSLFATGQSSFFSMGMFSVLIMSVISGPLVAVSIGARPHRTSALVAGIVIAVCNFVSTLGVGTITSTNFQSVLEYALWSMLGGPIAAILTIGLQPVFESLFNLTTPAKLLELSNPSQPLLRRLQVEAPGTYHHSIIVANLAEAGAAAVGANALLARVGAFYHDIGKLRRPIYFKENQMGDNPHDRTEPRVSASILTSHPHDGVLLAQKERIPAAICDIIQQHHGDTLAAYFYAKAKETEGDSVNPDDYRYPGPRPRSREAAVLMLADVTEAATRTLQSPSPETLMSFIRKLVSDRMQDGQLDDSELTFKDLDRVCNAFYTVLSGAFHERIEYPDVAIPDRSELPDEPESSEKHSRLRRRRRSKE